MRHPTARVTTVALSAVAALSSSTVGAQPAADAPPLIPFVLPWDDATAGPSNVSSWLDKPAGARGPVVARDGHLYAGDRRIKFLGVNMAFGGNFPVHADAESIAARMAKFGINCVRFHHMDMFSGPAGLMAKDMVALDAGQLDKLDYFIAALKRQGIYANLNLHVSRDYPNVPTWPDKPSFYKGVDLFYGPMIEQQRDFARRLLAHVNPYTKLSYADDPAVAFVEINNENGLIDQWWSGNLDAMPDPYRAELRGRWNTFLSKRYADDAALRAAWSAGEQPLGEDMLRNATFTGGLAPWVVELHENATATTTVSTDDAARPSLAIDVKQVSGTAWHVQLHQPGLRVRGGEPYTITLRAKASTPTRISVGLMQAHAPWEGLAMSEVALTTEWADHTFIVTPKADDDNARLTFSPLGATRRTFGFANLSLRPGGRAGLAEGEALGNVEPFKKARFGGRTPAAARDWMTFLYETETDYWTGMQRFLKDDLRVRAPIVGSATGFSPPTIQAQLDVVDGHMYWQHPHFPGKSWDMADWVVNNRSMAGADKGGVLPGLATRRVAGKPYIVTEYNASSPNTYGSEAFLLLGAYAALQDWDAIFPFAYSHRTDDWRSGKISGFFDIDQHPTKMATLPAVAAMFLRGDIATTDQPLVAGVTTAQAIDHSVRSGPWWNTASLGIPELATLVQPIAMRLTDAPATADGQPTAPAAPTEGSAIVSKTGELTWDTAGRATVANAPRSRAYIGQLPAGPIRLGDVSVSFAPNRQNWAALSLTAMDGPDFRSKGRLLITATGYAENTDMGWKNAERSTVGRDWGRSPSLVEGVGASLTFDVPAARVRLHPLDESGQRRDPHPATGTDRATVTLGPEHGTIWYEVEIVE